MEHPFDVTHQKGLIIRDGFFASTSSLSVVQWIERGPPKAEMQVRFLPGRPMR